MGWLAGWAKRIKITIDHNDVDASLSHFPILLYLSSSSGITGVDVTPIFDEVGANSKKIAVTKADGTTQLYVEIEKWDSVNEKAWLWVSRSGWSISNTVDTDIYIYYDNSKADNTTYVAVLGSRTEVWDNNYMLVWHMRDKDTTGIEDSTSNNIDGTKKGAGEPAVDVNGKIGDAQHYDGSNDFIKHLTFLDVMPVAVTIEFWFCPDVTFDSGAGSRVNHFIKFNDLTSNSYDGINVRMLEGDGRLYVTNLRDHVEKTLWSTTASWTGGTFYHIAFRLGSGGMELWVNSVSEDTDESTRMPHDGTAADAHWGIHHGEVANPFDGLQDEFRVSNTSRTAAWVKAGYESGRDHFVTYGSEETPPVKGKPASIIPLMRLLDFI